MHYEIMSNLLVISIVTVINSFLLVYFIIPKIWWVMQMRKLNDKPNGRSSHIGKTPSMAGLAFFITLIITLFFIQNFDTESITLNIIAALTIICMVGLKDDLVLSTPKAKIGAEILAISLILLHNSMQINSLNGFLGAFNLPEVVSVILIVLMMLTIINSYNLIDGIDGLASIIGIIIFSLYALIFYLASFYFYFLLCLSLIALLLSYLFYNFSTTKKIFMGDTGSLIIGFCIGVLTLKFLAIDTSLLSGFESYPENRLIVVVAILCIPLFDTFRVIGIRLLNGKSPLQPDRNHIHHILLDYGFSHSKISLLLGLLNYILVILLIYLSLHLNSFQMLAVILLIFVLLLSVFYKLKLTIKDRQIIK